MNSTNFAHHVGLFIRNHPVAVLCLLGLFSIICGFGALHSKVDNSLPVWQSSGDPHWQRYQEFVREHRLTDPLLIYLPEATVDTTEQLFPILETIPGVDHLSSTGVQPKKGKQATILSLFPKENATPLTLSILLTKVEQALDKKRAQPYHLGGVWLLTDRLDQLSTRSTQTMFPLVLVLLAAVLFFLRFAKRDIALIMACGLLPAFQLTGLMPLFGVKMNMILLALPPLTMILGISHAIHLISKKQAKNENPMDIFARVAPPCLLSGLTTALGFLSLLLGQYQPVRELGLWGAIGTLLSLLCSLLLLPLFFKPSNHQLPFHFFDLLPRLIIRWKKIILGGLVVAILLGLTGAQQLQRGSFILDFFTPDSSVRHDYMVIEQAGIGLTPLEVDLGVTRLSNKEIEKNMHLLAAVRPEITHILYGFASGLVVPQATENGALFTSMADLDLMLEKVNRITLLTSTLASEKTLELVDQIETFCQLRFGVRKLPYVTGSVPLYTRGQKKLFSSLVLSFSAAFISISLIMGLVLRSPQLGMLAILPNILPVILVLGVMGVVGIPLSVATVTVASIVFGIVVDDTIHFLHSWQGMQHTITSNTEKLQQVLTYAGPAMMTTTLVAGIGFLGFAVSPFLPLRNFGLLISLAMWLALFCDLILLPALLVSGETRQQ